MEANDYESSYESTTNWKLAGGPLLNSIKFESSFCSAADNDGEDENLGAPAAKSPLVLFPPSPDSESCEITITFAQKHELRQVYVRSTARVYEIYYATKLQRSNDYLCTVRCGTATRDEEVLQAPVIEEIVSANPKEVIKDLEGRRVKEVGTNEDDWVEVKASDASLLYSGKNLPVKPHRITQGLYEATAEINDAEPCISITLRLLSLQDKGCLFVDEVYIFADPVDPTETEEQVCGAENSAGSSLMAMFMPTLLQLSRARDDSRVQDKQASDEVEKKKAQETWRNTNELAKLNEIQPDRKFITADKPEANLQETACATAEATQRETSPQVSGTEFKPVSSSNHDVNVLHQLLSRVSRIEDILVRFEERLLVPINSIDARLQQVEQKLEELDKKSQNSVVPPCNRIVAPEFLCSDTDPESSYTDKSNNHDTEPDEPTKKSQIFQSTACKRIVSPEFPCRDTDPDSSYTNKTKNLDLGSSDYKEEDISTHNPSDDRVVPHSDSYSLPGTEEAAPELVDADEEENQTLGSSEEKPKHSLSINDALASALAGFLSSTLTEGRKYTQALLVKAPEFSNEEDGDDTDKKALTDTRLEESTKLSACSDATEKTIKDSLSSSLCISSTENEAEFTRFMKNNCDQMVKVVDEQCKHVEVGDDSNVSLAGHIVEQKGSDHLAGVIGNGETAHVTINILVFDEAEDPDMSIGDPTGDCSVTTQKEMLSSGFVTATEVKEEPKIDVLHSVLGFSLASSSLDFDTPILDVKFNSQQNSSDKSSIDTLLGGWPEPNAESVTTAECVDDTNLCNLIPVDDGEITGPPTDTLLSLDMNYCDISEMNLKVEDASQRDYHGSSCEEMPATSLI